MKIDVLQEAQRHQKANEFITNNFFPLNPDAGIELTIKLLINDFICKVTIPYHLF